MVLEKFRKDDAYEKDGIHYNDLEELVGTGFLSFCGCGCPDEAMQYVLDGLELIAEDSPDSFKDHEAWNVWWQGHRAKLDAHFKTDGARYFFWYWADKEELTEHGGSVPGWLTEKGRQLLEALREWRAALNTWENQ
jgi:hypothetical protein